MSMHLYVKRAEICLHNIRVPPPRERCGRNGTGTGQGDRQKYEQLNSRYYAAKLFSHVERFRRIYVPLSTEIRKKARGNYGDVYSWDPYRDRDVYGGNAGEVCALV